MCIVGTCYRISNQYYHNNFVKVGESFSQSRDCRFNYGYLGIYMLKPFDEPINIFHEIICLI